MKLEIRLNFTLYIKAKLVNNDFLIKEFATITPTSTDIENYITREEIDKSGGVTSKAVENFFKGLSKKPEGITLDYIAQLFKLNITLKEFHELWRTKKITAQDLIIYKKDGEEYRNDILQTQYIDFTDFIEERTQDFVGRKSVFQAVQEFQEKYESGYFVLTGKPGMGKSAYYGKSVKQQQLTHHFINSDRQGRNTAKAVLGNIAFRLDKKFRLELKSVGFNDVFINQLLKSVSDKLKKDESCSIIIDGIDELSSFETLKKDKKTNILFLPRTLPKGIYFLLSIREFDDLPLQAMNIKHFELHPNSEENQADIREYICSYLDKEGIKEFLKKNKMSSSDFESKMYQKSEGNFMYLHCVLPQIEKGYYHDVTLEKVPAGLDSYYEDHWERIKGEDEKAWFEYKLPIISMLTLSGMTLSVEMIREYARLPKTAMVVSVLENWKQFFFEKNIGLNVSGKSHLNTFKDFLEKKVSQVEEERESNDSNIKLYKLYHSSFKDFLEKKAEVQAEKIDIRRFVSEFILKYQKLYNSERIAQSVLDLHENLKGDIRVD